MNTVTGARLDNRIRQAGWVLPVAPVLMGVRRREPFERTPSRRVARLNVGVGEHACNDQHRPRQHEHRAHEDRPRQQGHRDELGLQLINNLKSEQF